MEQMQEVAATLDVLTNDSVSAADKVAYFTQLVMEQIDNTDIETQVRLEFRLKKKSNFTILRQKLRRKSKISLSSLHKSN